MEKTDVKLLEFYYYILKTCFAYEIHMGPGMTYLDLWQELVVKLDVTARERLKTQVVKEIENKKTATLERMLFVLTDHAVLHDNAKQQIS